MINLDAMKPTVDPKKQTTCIKVRLYNSQQVSMDLNLDHQILDLYSYVNSVAPLPKGFKLFAGYPPKALEGPDMMATIAEMRLNNSQITQ